MSNIYTSADQLIGKTPLLELTHIEKKHDLKAKILAKLEYFNPAGSVKDRIAKAMIDEAEAKGQKVKMLVFTNPNNPTGTVYSEEEMRRVLRFCRKHNIHLVPMGGVCDA